MDINFIMSVILWVSAFAAVVSFLTAIGAIMIARAEVATGATGEEHRREEPMWDSPFPDTMAGDGPDVDGIWGDDGEKEDVASDDIVFGFGRGESSEAPGPVTGGASVKGDVARRRGDDNAAEKTPNKAVTPMGSVVSKILLGVDASGRPDSEKSESYKEEARMRVNQWDTDFGRGEWNWDSLIQATECYVQAIRHAPGDPYSWINLAFVYHLFGDKDKALQCLDKSNTLDELDSDGAGRDYRQVEKAVKNNTALFGEKLARPAVPARFRDRQEKLLRFLPSASRGPSGVTAPVALNRSGEA
uniref:Tetratricopeptide repeat-containing protein n=1 Tax=Candidatus Kentrum sp. DK TaxID=2126562 RepID=A0A450S8P8_9GAMM|nr:MAG: Tetratricopeptide repeat-containing protein [Candidatus Kentron sp. DK]